MSPDEENAVLSQNDIDALVGSTPDAGGQTPAEPEAAQTPTDAEAASAREFKVAASFADSPPSADVVQRLKKLEAAVSVINQGGNPQANIQALAQQLQALSSRVEEILQHLPNTLGYGVRETFQCSTCSAQSLVAARVMCTHCGTETAIGWWPQT